MGNCCGTVAHFANIKTGGDRMYTYIPAEESNITVNGRTVKENPLPLFWTGSGVEFVTDGGELYFEIETDYSVHEQWIRIVVNGFPAVRMPLAKGNNTVCAFRGFAGAGKKTVQLLKEVQPMRIDEENQLRLLSVRTDGQIFSSDPKKYKIEFVGDSITSGEGLGGTAGMHIWAPAIFSTQGHYALKIAQKLSAEIRILSQSGWGVLSSWDNDPVRSMPPYYETICGVIKGQQNKNMGAYKENDFDAWKPDAIVINLGSNDAYAFDNPAWTDESGKVFWQRRKPDGSFEEASIRRFEQAVFDFLVKLRHYNRESILIWAYGMIDHTMQPYIEHALNRYREERGDRAVEFLQLPPLRDGWYGANDHPGVLSHQAAADVLGGRLLELLERDAL